MPWVKDAASEAASVNGRGEGHKRKTPSSGRKAGSGKYEAPNPSDGQKASSRHPNNFRGMRSSASPAPTAFVLGPTGKTARG